MACLEQCARRAGRVVLAGLFLYNGQYEAHTKAHAVCRGTKGAYDTATFVFSVLGVCCLCGGVFYQATVFVFDFVGAGASRGNEFSLAQKNKKKNSHIFFSYRRNLRSAR
jgi:hypothetical protein